jgi:hypothetical protein
MKTMKTMMKRESNDSLKIDGAKVDGATMISSRSYNSHSPVVALVATGRFAVYQLIT